MLCSSDWHAFLMCEDQAAICNPNHALALTKVRMALTASPSWVFRRSVALGFVSSSSCTCFAVSRTAPNHQPNGDDLTHQQSYISLIDLDLLLPLFLGPLLLKFRLPSRRVVPAQTLGFVRCSFTGANLESADGFAECLLIDGELVGGFGVFLFAPGVECGESCCFLGGLFGGVNARRCCGRGRGAFLDGGRLRLFCHGWVGILVGSRMMGYNGCVATS